MNFIISKEDYIDIKTIVVSRIEDLKKENPEFDDLVELFGNDNFFSKFFSSVVLALVNQCFCNGTYFSVKETIEDLTENLKLSEVAHRQMDWVLHEMQASVFSVISHGNMYAKGNLYRVDVCKVEWDVKGILGRLVLPMETVQTFGDCIDISKMVEDIRIGV